LSIIDALRSLMVMILYDYHCFVVYVIIVTAMIMTTFMVLAFMRSFVIILLSCCHYCL